MSRRPQYLLLGQQLLKWNPDFLNLLGKRKLVLIIAGVGKIGGKITVFDWGREASFGSNYREFSETGMRVREIRILLY